MRLLAGKKNFKEALSVYDFLVRDGLEPSPVTQSCLVGFAAELGDNDRAVKFFEEFSSRCLPSIRACMTILRVYASRKDWESSLALYHTMHQRGVPVDSIVLNIVLSTGVSVGNTIAAAELLNKEP